MKVFFKKFFSLFGEIAPLDKLYYILYSVTIAVVYVIYSLLPLLYKQIIDKLIIKQAYKAEIFLYIAITIISIGIFRVWSFTNIIIQKRVKCHLSNYLFSILLNNRKKVPELFSIHLEAVCRLFLDFVYTIPSEMLSFIIQLGIIFAFSPDIGCIVLLGIIFFVILTYYREKWVLPTREKSQSAYVATFQTLDEILSGTPDIQMLEAGKWADRQLEMKCSSRSKATRRYELRKSSIHLLNQINTWVLPCFIAMVSLYKVANGYITIGTGLMIIQFSNSLNNEFISIHQNMSYLMDFTPNMDKVIEGLELRPEKNEKTSPIAPQPKNVILSVENISKSFGDRLLFSQLSFSVRKGEILAIKGESGSGKTTLLSIIAGYEKADNGSVLISNHIKIGFLSQSIYLFQRTLRENLLLAKPNASVKEMEDALARAGLSTYYNSLPYGLETQLGENGSAISGGQCARLGLARILLQDADLVLLDEPLTNVDSATRKDIIAGLRDFLVDKACVLVSHDPEIIHISTKSIRIGRF